MGPHQVVILDVPGGIVFFRMNQPSSADTTRLVLDALTA
jgi:hypothetical protein